MYSDEAAKLFAEESGCVLPTTTASSYLPEKVKDKDGNEIDNQKHYSTKFMIMGLRVVRLDLNLLMQLKGLI